MSRNWSLRLRLLVALGFVAAGYLLLVPLVLVLLRFASFRGHATVAAVVVASLPLLLILFGHRLALRAAEAVYIDPDDYPGLFSSLHRLSQQAGVSTPRLAVVACDDPNAFTAGSGSRAVVCVTTGLLRTLDAEEREAVFAHELSHLKNSDAVVMTLAAFPLTVSGLFLTLSGAAMGASKDGGFGAVMVGFVLLLPSLALLLVSYPAVLVIANAREYAADRGAVAITGNPSALASALRTLDDVDEKPDRDMRSLGPVSAFCIVAPSWSTLQFPGLHPPTEKRVERLRRIEQQTETT